MSTIQIAEFMLWKTIKEKRGETLSLFPSEPRSNSEDIVFPNEMICRVCASPADIPITDKIEGIDILTAIRNVAYIWVSRNDTYPKYVCKSCLEELKVALTFKKKCESSENMFRQIHPQMPLPSKKLPMKIHDFALIIHQMRERKLMQRKSSPKINRQSIESCKIERSSEQFRPQKSLKCQRCQLTFENKEQLVEHRLQRNCVCPPCPICGKLVSNLARHKKNVHVRSDKYTCHICGKISYSSGGLRNHLLVHSDKCNYQCPLCPYKGKQQAYLTLHMRVHTGERPYLCSECPAKFVNPSNLRKHQLVHSSKKYECNKCKKQFRLLKTLEEHYEAAHLNIRYRCSICGRDLWTRRKLLSHELRVHNREKHKLYQEVYKVVLNDDND